MDEKKEFFVHILNQSIIANSPREAAKILHEKINKSRWRMVYFTFSVTYQEIDGDMLPIPIEDFDLEEWGKEDQYEFGLPIYNADILEEMIRKVEEILSPEEKENTKNNDQTKSP